MKHGDYSAFGWLDQFELSPTPALCECVRKWLREQAAMLKPTAKQSSYRDIVFSRYLGTLRWFASKRCPMLDELSACEAALLSYPGGKANDPGLFDSLDEIKRMPQAPSTAGGVL